MEILILILGGRGLINKSIDQTIKVSVSQSINVLCLVPCMLSYLVALKMETL